MDRKVSSEVLAASVPTEPLAIVAAYPLTALNTVSRCLGRTAQWCQFLIYPLLRLGTQSDLFFLTRLTNFQLHEE